MTTLWRYFLNNRGRVLDKWEHYFPIYEENLHEFQNKSILVFEIGCGLGGSLQMWKQYFGPMATIVGIDKKQFCTNYEENGIHVRIGSQSDNHFLQSILSEFGVPDIVIDDGSHRAPQVNASFEFLYPKMRPNSLYLVEDTHTSYWEEYEGGLNNPNSFMNKVKSYVDLINADHSRGQIEPTSFTRETFSIKVYDSIVCFKKGIISRKVNYRTGIFDKSINYSE